IASDVSYEGLPQAFRTPTFKEWNYPEIGRRLPTVYRNAFASHVSSKENSFAAVTIEPALKSHRIFYRDTADVCDGCTGVEDRLNVFISFYPAAEIDDEICFLCDAFENRQICDASIFRSIEINDMKPCNTRGLEMFCCFCRVIAVNGCSRKVALREPYAFSVDKINGRDYLDHS